MSGIGQVVSGGWLAWLRSGARACFSGTDTPRRMVLEERLPLAPKHCLYLVRCGSERFLLATGGDAALQWIALTGETATPQAAARLATRPEARLEARPEARPESRSDAARTRRRGAPAPLPATPAGHLPAQGGRR